MHIIPSVAAFATLSALVYAQDSGKACNNAAALCDRSYGDITHLGAHDSFSVRTKGNDYTVAADQFYNSIQQLDAGVRLLTAQVHKSSPSDDQSNLVAGVGSGAAAVAAPQVTSGAASAAQAVATGASKVWGDVTKGLGIDKRQAPAPNNTDLQGWRLCHSDCMLYDGGSLVDWLSGIKGWLDGHPDDVVTILLVNSDNADAPTLNNIFTASGIDHYAYQPQDPSKPPQTWPTLSDLITQNKRLVTFIASLEPSSNQVAPYLLDEFTFVFENSYDNVQPTDFSCLPDRPSNVKGDIQSALSTNHLPLMNHFRYDKNNGIEIPSVDNVQTTNSASGGAGNLGDAANNCTSQYNRAPAFILVDFFNVGDALATVDNLNKVAGQTTGRLIVPDTVDASQASPSPAAYQGDPSTAGVSAMDQASPSVAAKATHPNSAAGSSQKGPGMQSLMMAVGMSVVSCGVWTTTFSLA